jgi:hypothetical protein
LLVSEQYVCVFNPVKFDLIEPNRLRTLLEELEDACDRSRRVAIDNFDIAKSGQPIFEDGFRPLQMSI